MACSVEGTGGRGPVIETRPKALVEVAGEGHGETGLPIKLPYDLLTVEEAGSSCCLVVEVAIEALG
ncbi:hypothetical protein CKO15_12915 [Halorhodospira abdelmalekii]|nr:hypothetical protein [Halorhodospira abdelmalekii]MBK1736156.1 hypothetical protein [Halorhodospira abdelmalekii]